MKKNKPKIREHKEIQVSEPREITQVETFISQAIANNVPVETMEKLLAMRKELKQERAKELFDESMSGFQGECPIIKKGKDGGKTKGGMVAYRYAPLDSIVRQTKDLIKKHGFSYSIQTQTGEGKVSVTCKVKHVAGHSEESSVEVPLGANTGIMSSSQVVASALTFAKRYAFSNAFGILTSDDDDDANETKKADKKVYSNAEKLYGVIVKEEDLDKLIEYSEKIKVSELYNKEEKKMLQDLITSKIDHD